MKTLSPALATLLASGQFVKADLWTITLRGGDILRWTSHDQDVWLFGTKFTRGPLIDRGNISEKTGLEVSVLEMTITGGYLDLVGSVPLIQFIAQHGLDGANIRLDRAYAPDWGSPLVGSILRFSGKVTSTPSIQGITAQVEVSSWTILLNAQLPRNRFQSGCLRTLYDLGCGVIKEDYGYADVVSAPSAGSRTSFGSTLVTTPSFFSQGQVIFITGANINVSRSIRSYDGLGNFTLISPLPYPCGAGDAFSVYAGCDLTPGTCDTRFNNLLRFKATPFVPVPTTPLGSASATTPTGGK